MKLSQAFQDGIIKLDTEQGKQLGFTSDKFDGWLWNKDGYIYVSFIVSKQPFKGNLKKLFQKIASLGFGIKVPTPFSRMKDILQKTGFHKTEEWFPEAMEFCEVWVLKKDGG